MAGIHLRALRLASNIPLPPKWVKCGNLDCIYPSKWARAVTRRPEDAKQCIPGAQSGTRCVGSDRPPIIRVSRRCQLFYMGVDSICWGDLPGSSGSAGPREYCRHRFRGAVVTARTIHRPGHRVPRGDTRVTLTSSHRWCGHRPSRPRESPLVRGGVVGRASAAPDRENGLRVPATGAYPSLGANRITKRRQIRRLSASSHN